MTISKKEHERAFADWWGSWLDAHPSTRPTFAYSAARAAYDAGAERRAAALGGIADPEAWVRSVRELVICLRREGLNDCTCPLHAALRAVERAERGE